MPETCKEAALYFNPYDVFDMTNKIRSLVDDENLVKTYKEKSLERVKHISDNYSSSNKTLEIINNLNKS